MSHCLFTIGHSDLEQGQLLGILREHSIGAIADVRSLPYSGRSPQFNREAIEYAARQAGIHYVFLGKELGARREESECYLNGQAKYHLIARTSAFQFGLERVVFGLQRFNLVLLCAEHDPITCHRMILVCKHLRHGVPEIRHLSRDGTYETNEQAEKRLLRAIGVKTGFANSVILEQAYHTQSERIAYGEETQSSKVSRTSGRPIEPKLL